eukprot:1161078-Pelagomonas_calceolata.AAC.30
MAPPDPSAASFVALPLHFANTSPSYLRKSYLACSDVFGDLLMDPAGLQMLSTFCQQMEMGATKFPSLTCCVLRLLCDTRSAVGTGGTGCACALLSKDLIWHIWLDRHAILCSITQSNFGVIGDSCATQGPYNTRAVKHKDRTALMAGSLVATFVCNCAMLWPMLQWSEPHKILASTERSGQLKCFLCAAYEVLNVQSTFPQ